MAASERLSVQAKLQENLVEFGSLTKQLVDALTGSGKPVGDMQTTLEVLDKFVARNGDIQELVSTANEMCSREREVVSVEEELEMRKRELCQLQAKLQEAEKIIELAVYKCRQKLDAIECSEKASVSPEVLIQYAHRISQASSVVSPVGWQPSDARRPFPHDIEMRCGFLGQLTSGIKPHSQGTGISSSAERAENPPPHDKRKAITVLAGRNQNSNNHENGNQLAAKLVTGGPAAGVLAEPELMSEDSSPSSDEET